MILDELFDLTGRVAIVTGGRMWLGADMAAILAEAGANVIITSRNQEEAENAASLLEHEFRSDSMGLQLDQCNYNSVEEMAEKAIKWKGHVDILVNNAGGGVGKSKGHLFERSAEDIKSMIATNLTGLIFCCKAIAPQMVKQKYGRIINIASIAGVIGRDRRMYQRSGMNGQPVDYAAAKAGVIGLTRDLAGLLSPHGINVNAISPGGFLKPGDLPQTFVDELAEGTMKGRWGKMGDDIKGTALFLASAASEHITAQNIVVDGGFTHWK
jgi:NAD(P)-dependent dehydrogenase (short-subunit alcohol dehydrogenase family)